MVFANYTSGPFPISRTPTGEFFSGTCQGLGIPFLFIFVNGNWDKLFALHISSNWNFTISGNVLAFLTVILACTPSWLLTSNVMLADNLSDRVADQANGRHTLPNVFGRKKASNLYRFLAYAGYVALVLGACLRLLPWLTLLTLLTIPVVHQKTEAFLAKPVKNETFVLALQNFQVVVGVEIITLFLGYFLHF